jgi:hypothetical protein
MASESMSYRPLRPLNVGGLFEEVLRLYQQNFLSLIAIVAVVQVAVAILLGLIRLSFAHGPTLAGVFLGLVTAVFSILASFLQAGALTLAVADDYLGQPITIERAYAAAHDRLGALVGSSLLVALLLGLMTIVIVGIPFAIYFGVRWVFVAQAVMLDRVAGTTAMSRSAALVDGFWLRTLGVILLMAVIAVLVSSIVGAVIGVLFGGTIISALLSLALQIVIAPFYSVVLTLLYFDMRVRKEALTAEGLAGVVRGT